MGTEFCTAADCVGGGVDAEVEIGGELPLKEFDTVGWESNASGWTSGFTNIGGIKPKL